MFECVIAAHIYTLGLLFDLEMSVMKLNLSKAVIIQKIIKKTRSKENARAFYFEQRVIKRSTQEKRIVFFI